MKKSTVAIIILLLTIIYGIIFYSYHIKNSKKELEATLKTAEEKYELNKKISELENEIEKLKNGY